MLEETILLKSCLLSVKFSFNIQWPLYAILMWSCGGGRLTSLHNLTWLSFNVLREVTVASHSDMHFL